MGLQVDQGVFYVVLGATRYEDKEFCVEEAHIVLLVPDRLVLFPVLCSGVILVDLVQG